MTNRILALLFAIALLSACSSKSQPPPVAKEAPAPKPVKITQFYASPPNPAPGQKSMVCYSTENATAVEIDPPDYPVWPSPVRCFEVVPKKKMTLKLTARRDAEQVVQMVTLAPGAPPPELVELRVDAMEVAAGSPIHVCYRAKNAASVTLTPGEYLQHDADYGCVQMVLQKTTRFSVRVRDKDGDIVDGEDVDVRVKP
jgi:hypothetical protein